MKTTNKSILSLFMLLAIVVIQFARPFAVHAAGIVVNTLTDVDSVDGFCSLREAIQAANTDAAYKECSAGTGNDTITFSVSGTITLSATLPAVTDTDGLTINGGGSIAIAGGGSLSNYRALTVNSSMNFSIANLTITNFRLVGNGGAMYLDTGSNISITNVTFNTNNAVDGYGGAIYVNGATLGVTNSTFSTNGANVTSIGDFALGGGAIQNNDGTVTISGSAFSGNFVDSYTADGGAIYNGDFDSDAVDTLTITNSTFYNNQLLNDTGGSAGGAIRSNSVMTLVHNTFSGNDSGLTEAGGESGGVTVASGSATLKNNIFANSSNSAADCAIRTGATLNGSSGGNLIENNHSSPNNCGTPFSTNDPNLGLFQNNGGLTSTLAVISPSDAINTVACAAGVTTDQRGVSRPQESNCEIGSFETGDSIGPTVTNVTSTATNGAYGVGSVVPVTVTFNEIVVVTGTPQLTLETGATDRVVNYASGSGSTTLTFNYTVQAGDTSSDLDYVGIGSLALNGGTVKDGANNNATLTLAVPGAAGSLGANKNIVIDTTSPAVTNVTSSTPNGSYGVGSVIAVTVTFNESVTVTGTPQLTLETGATDRAVNYSSGSGGTTLTFNYTVQAGDTSGDLDYVGTGSLTLNGGTIKDLATNNATLTLASPGAAGSLGNNKSIVIDGTAPTVTITSTAPNPTNTSPIPVTITFSESVTGFVVGDLTLGNGTASGFSGSGTTYTVNITPSANGAVTVNVAGSVATDSAGNGNTAATQLSRTFDNVAPTVSITSTAPSSTNTSPIPVTITFSESVTGFVVGDLTLGNGTASGFSGSGTTYTVDITPSANGAVTVDVAGSVAVDAAGNNNTAATQLTRTYDTVAPTVTITSTAPNPTNTSPIPVTITFSESVTGFVVGDLTLGNGTASGFSGSGTTYTVNITPSANGAVTVNVAGSVATDSAGNGNTAATQLSRTYDGTAPTVTITSTAPNPTNTSPIPVTITFSESVTGFVVGDLTLGNGTASGFSGSGTTYTVNITPSANGAVTVNVAGSVATDSAGNGNTAATQLSRTFDNVAPTVSITSTAPSSTNTSPIPVTITFSESVTGFVVGDLTLGNGTASGFSGSGTTYTVDITPSANGAVTVDVAGSVAVDAAGNNNTAATQLTRTYDTVAPTVSITSKPADPTNSTSANFVFTTAGSPILVECKLDGGSYAACETVTTQSYAGPLSEGSHTFTVKVTDAATNSSTDAYTWSIDITPPSLSIDMGPSNPTNATSASFTFTVGGDAVAVDCKLDSGAYATCATTSSQSYAGPISDGSHVFTLRVTDAVGNSDTATYNWVVDLIPTVSSITRVNTNPTSAASVNFTVTFSEDVTGVDLSTPFADFTLTTTGVTGAAITGASGSGKIYTVTVGTGTGNGTIHLNVVDDDTIVDATGNKLGGTGNGNGDFITGDTYNVNKNLTKTIKSTGPQDGWILESSETSNKGGTLNTTSSMLYVGDNAQDKQYKSFVSFNTAGLPDNAIVTSIKLKIKIQGFTGGNMFTPTKTLGNLLMDIRKPYFGTSAGLATSDFQFQTGVLNSVGALGNVPATGWRTVTLKSTAYSLINLTGTTQFRLRFAKDDNDDLGNDFLKIFSGNAPAASRPQLIIIYHLP